MQQATLRHEDVSEQLRRVFLAGRLDMVGMEEIHLKFTALTASRPLQVIVDLTDVSFLASIGIRSIISSARALDRKSGRMVLLVGDNDTVKATLKATGIDTVIPVVASEAEAVAALQSAGT